MSWLKDHLFSYLCNSDGQETTFTIKDHSTISILNNQIYHHKVLRVNYTTYDMHCAQDSLNPWTHGNIMVLSHKEDQECASLLVHTHCGYLPCHGHTEDCWFKVVQSKKMEFLFVQWFGLDTEELGGWKAKRLHQIGFLDSDDPSAFCFLDPADMVHAMHLIPRFLFGWTGDLLGHSIAQSLLDQDEDWVRYYVNM